MISRRNLISGAAASAAMASLKSREARAALTGAIPGVIRWDAWYSQLPTPRLYQDSLGPSQWQFRAPWFTTVDSPFHVTSTGTQANMDLEIRLAAQAGIKYFAFLWYSALPGSPHGPTVVPGMDVSFTLYSNSTFKSQTKWCVIAVPSTIGASTPFANNDWQASCNAWVTYFQQTNYQKVLTNRPLMYFFWSDAQAITTFGSIANFATALAYLRSQCSAAGVGDPYVVMMSGVGATAAATITATGADACSLYTAAMTTTALPDTAATLDTQTQATWTQLAASGSPIIPIIQHGWDIRPRKINAPAGGVKPLLGLNSYFTPGTPTQIAAQYTEAFAYIEANPSICPSKATLSYSWTENDEGGGAAIPTLGDPPVNAESGQALPTSNLLKALGTVLRAAA